MSISARMVKYVRSNGTYREVDKRCIFYRQRTPDGRETASRRSSARTHSGMKRHPGIISKPTAMARIEYLQRTLYSLMKPALGHIRHQSQTTCKIRFHDVWASRTRINPGTANEEKGIVALPEILGT